MNTDTTIGLDLNLKIHLCAVKHGRIYQYTVYLGGMLGACPEILVDCTSAEVPASLHPSLLLSYSSQVPPPLVVPLLFLPLPRNLKWKCKRLM